MLGTSVTTSVFIFYKIIYNKNKGVDIMAKIVDVAYGLSNINSKKTYKYIVNDNVKRGSVLTPVVKHYKSGKIYTTMGVVQQSKGGKSGMTEQEWQQLMKDTSGELKIAQKPTNAFNQALRTKDAKNQYQYTGEKGFTDKYDNFFDGMVRVGNETYENNKMSNEIQTERTNIANSVQTETIGQDSSGAYETYREAYAKYMKGQKK